ncbi:hypothetical protein CEXT_323871 [Caerostris extrusa]|uniref:Uncharacterized protein n=1 Tax=Caerostris extrusa TaxID=172846 RepID=A0AAV4SX48_CAEEX|nr:hypothetical protein CEXT_323871 [Caerostris extrusa]
MINLIVMVSFNMHASGVKVDRPPVLAPLETLLTANLNLQFSMQPPYSSSMKLLCSGMRVGYPSPRYARSNNLCKSIISHLPPL